MEKWIIEAQDAILAISGIAALVLVVVLAVWQNKKRAEAMKAAAGRLEFSFTRRSSLDNAVKALGFHLFSLGGTGFTTYWRALLAIWA